MGAAESASSDTVSETIQINHYQRVLDDAKSQESLMTPEITIILDKRGLTVTHEMHSSVWDQIEFSLRDSMCRD
jgi:hypothetical protein